VQGGGAFITRKYKKRYFLNIGEGYIRKIRDGDRPPRQLALNWQ